MDLNEPMSLTPMNMNMKLKKPGAVPSPYRVSSLLKMPEKDFKQLQWIVSRFIGAFNLGNASGEIGRPSEASLVFDDDYLKQTGIEPLNAWTEIGALTSELKARGYVTYEPRFFSENRDGKQVFIVSFGDDDGLNEDAFFRLSEDIVKAVLAKRERAQEFDSQALTDSTSSGGMRSSSTRKVPAQYSPYCFVENGMGFFKFYKTGEGIEIGKPETRKYRLLDCLVKHDCAMKVVNDVFNAIKLPRDDKDQRLKFDMSAYKRKLEIIRYTVKELQKHPTGEKLHRLKIKNDYHGFWLEFSS